MNTEPSVKYEDDFRAIYEACEEGILAVDLTGAIQMANKSAHQIFGYAEDELKGKTIEDLIPRDRRKAHKANRNNFMKHPTARRMGAGRDLKAMKKNGDVFPVEISLNKATLSGKMHIIAYVVDISERKKIEEALMKSEAQLIHYATELEKRVKRRTNELDNTINQLEKMNQELAEAEQEAQTALERERELNELKSRFVSMASHEFRTPLSTILSSISLIDKYAEKNNPEKIQSHAVKVKTAINNLNGILNDFLSLAKLEEGRIDLDIQALNVSEIAHEVVEELSSIFKTGQAINILVKGDEKTIDADKKILKNIMINLLSNAIKYSEENKHVTLTLDFTADEFLLAIKDQGMGIPLSDQKHLFERFFRAHNTMNIQGTGLGLNIVKKYIDMLHGSINFTSEVHEGSEFIVKLPYQQ